MLEVYIGISNRKNQRYFLYNSAVFIQSVCSLEKSPVCPKKHLRRKEDKNNLQPCSCAVSDPPITHITQVGFLILMFLYTKYP